MDKYSYLVNGEAAEDIQQFLQGEHIFQEFCEQVEKYRQVAAEISDLDSIVHFDMVIFRAGLLLLLNYCCFYFLCTSIIGIRCKCQLVRLPLTSAYWHFDFWFGLRSVA